MVVRMAHLPEDTPVPVNFKRGAALPRSLTDEARGIPDDFAIVVESPPFGQVTVQAWRIRHLPAVNDIALKVDKIDTASACQWREQRKPMPGSIGITGA